MIFQRFPNAQFNDQFQEYDAPMPSICGTSQEVFGQRISDHVPQEFTFAPEGSEGSGIQVLSWNIMARALCRRRIIGISWRAE